MAPLRNTLPSLSSNVFRLSGSFLLHHCLAFQASKCCPFSFWYPLAPEPIYFEKYLGEPEGLQRYLHFQRRLAKTVFYAFVYRVESDHQPFQLPATPAMNYHSPRRTSTCFG